MRQGQDPCAQEPGSASQAKYCAVLATGARGTDRPIEVHLHTWEENYRKYHRTETVSGATSKQEGSHDSVCPYTQGLEAHTAQDPAILKTSLVTS